jgi:hypothetical protein
VLRVVLHDQRAPVDEAHTRVPRQPRACCAARSARRGVAAGSVEQRAVAQHLDLHAHVLQIGGDRVARPST